MIGWWIGSRGYANGFESGVVTEDLRYAVIFPLYKGKGVRTECKNYRGVSLLSVVEKYMLGS